MKMNKAIAIDTYLRIDGARVQVRRKLAGPGLESRVVQADGTPFPGHEANWYPADYDAIPNEVYTPMMSMNR